MNKITDELNGATEYLRAMIKTGHHKEDCENVLMHLANIDDLIKQPVNVADTDDKALHIDCVKARYSGLEEKLREIRTDHFKDLENFKYKHKQLMNKVQFCQEHKFAEEERITRVQWDAQNMLLLNYKDIVTQIDELLEAWDS